MQETSALTYFGPQAAKLLRAHKDSLLIDEFDELKTVYILLITSFLTASSMMPASSDCRIPPKYYYAGL